MIGTASKAVSDLLVKLLMVAMELVLFTHGWNTRVIRKPVPPDQVLVNSENGTGRNGSIIVGSKGDREYSDFALYGYLSIGLVCALGAALFYCCCKHKLFKRNGSSSPSRRGQFPLPELSDTYYPLGSK